jgi:hypothetical protein
VAFGDGTPGALGRFTMMKPLLVGVLGLLAVGSQALADKPQPKKDKKPNCGDNYVVGGNRDKKTLTDAQIAEAMKAYVADVDHCWQQAPDELRKVDTAATLHLDIDDLGEVQTVELSAKAPPEVQRCISVAGARWQFPEADDSTQADYKLTLHAQ